MKLNHGPVLGEVKGTQRDRTQIYTDLLYNCNFMNEQTDIIDTLIKLGIFATFIVFGIAVWLLKKEKDKKKKQDNTDK